LSEQRNTAGVQHESLVGAGPVGEAGQAHRVEIDEVDLRDLFGQLVAVSIRPR
jgi:hypothetical protein